MRLIRCFSFGKVSNSRGMNAHLAKPLDAEKMIVALKQCMEDNRDIKLHEDL